MIKANRILLFSDSYGLPILLQSIPEELIIGVVIASIRINDKVKIEVILKDTNIPIFVQPAFKNGESYNVFYSKLKEIKPELIICSSYSMLIRQDVFNLVRGRAYNVHYSLLPLNRGPNPVQWALIKGEEKTGITIHQMHTTIDTGPIAFQLSVEISEDDTWVSLLDKLTMVSEGFLKKRIPYLINKQVELIKQDEWKASTNVRLTPDSPLIDFNKMTDLEIYNLIRGQVKPLKGAYLISDTNRVYINEFTNLTEIQNLRLKYE